MQRRFAIIGHRATSNGKLNLNDLAGSCGRMDVLIRAVNSALFLSHGLRENCQITLHLMGGPGPSRRIWFDSNRLKGLHVEERAIAGRISSILQEPVPAIGQIIEFSPGLWYSGGDISNTLSEWLREEVCIILLDAEGSELDNRYDEERIGFILSDDQTFSQEEEELFAEFQRRSVGKLWLQGHSAITVVHHILDQS